MMKDFVQEKHWICGGLNVVFAGDHSQLEPLNRDPICKDGNESWFSQHAVNCHIELDGRWRFKDDPRWGSIMARFRQGVPTSDDIETINENCFARTKDPPPDIQVATHNNKNRCAINTSIFDEFTAHCGPDDGSVLEGTCVTFVDDVAAEGDKNKCTAVQSNAVLKHFCENVTESDIGTQSKQSGKFDPCLKLCQDSCPVMCTKNSDVESGQANGTRAIMKRCHLKGGERCFNLKLDDGTTVKAVFASQVKSIELQHENPDITPNRFEIGSQTWTFKCKMSEADGMDASLLGFQGTAFAVMSNSCATGHKLQGCTVDNILVNDWHCRENWVHVVSSRVKTMAGLHTRQKLSADLKKCEKGRHMKNMMSKFAATVAVSNVSDAECEQLEVIDYVAPVRLDRSRESSEAF